jgi:hypothetical protein
MIVAERRETSTYLLLHFSLLIHRGVIKICKMATTRIALPQWLSFLILREKRKHDAYAREDNNNGDANNNNNFVKKKKEAQLEYIETAVSVALLLVQSLISSSFAAQQIAIDSFSVVIEDGGNNLEENPEDENLQRIIESITQLEFIPSDDSVHDANGGQQSDDVSLREVGTILHQLFCRGVKPPVSPTSVSSPDEGEGDADEDHQGDRSNLVPKKGGQSTP